MSCEQKHGHCGCSAAKAEPICSCHEHTHEEDSACNGGCSCGGHETHEQQSACSCHSHEAHQGCGCGCSHSHGGGKYLPERIAVSAMLLATSFFLPEKTVLWYLLIGAAYLMTGFSVLKEAVENLLHGKLFDECFLMTVASVGAIILGEWQEAAAVMILYQFGEYLQGKAVDSSRRSIKALMNVRPDRARVLRDGVVFDCPAQEVSVGAVIEVQPGERIPLDGLVIDGVSTIDQAALTGESLPIEVENGAKVLAGSVNLSGVLRLRVEKEFSDSAASRILYLAEEASEKKARTEQFITRFARIYTPAVVIFAVLLAVLPPLLGMGSWSAYIYRALDFLVISCPCALVISVPLTYFAGIGCASRNGILIKGGNYLDVLAKVETAAFDKTGTLTEGRFAVTDLLAAEGFTAEQLLELAAYGESASAHPLAQSILTAYSAEILRERLSDQHETAGKGVSCQLDGKALVVGKENFLRESGIILPNDLSVTGTAVLVGYDGRFAGSILLRDQAKADAASSLTELKELGVRHTVLLSGDREEAVQMLQKELDIAEAHGGLLPADKVARMEELRKENNRKGTILYVGDGINDAPILSLADVGISMGGLGTDAAIEAADVVLMTDSLGKIPLAIRIARKTGRVAKQNIILALGIKFAVMILAMLGQVGLWIAVFADVGVCLLAVLNSLRAAKN